MSAWLVGNGVVVAAVVALVLVGSLPSPAQRLSRWAWPVLFGALLLSALGFKLVLNKTSFVTNSPVSTTIKYAIERIESARAANLLLIDGGSLTARGVDGKILEAELTKRGYSVRVVRLARGATNHFERYQMYRDILDKLEVSAHPKQRWTMLAEAHVGYDFQPLAQFHNNQDTTRALHYLTPENALYAMWAQRDPQLTPPSPKPWLFELLRETLINGFNVGVTNRLVSLDEVEAEGGAVTNSRHRINRDPNMRPSLKELRQPTPDPTPPPWLKSIRERRIQRLWGSRLDAFVYFALPTTNVDQLKYARGFCKETRQKCIAPTDEKLLQTFASRSHWHDRSHLNRSGAAEYTRWLAARLEQEGVLVK